MNQNSAIYKKLLAAQRAAHDVLDSQADGVSIIEAMWIGQCCRRFGNQAGSLLDGPRFNKQEDQ